MSVLFVASTANQKIGSVACTYVTLNSCAKYCAIAHECYARHGNVGLHTARLDRAAHAMSSDLVEIAQIEASMIAYNAMLPTNRDKHLRLHVSGDSFTITGTELISKSCELWTSNGGASVWTFTHAWRAVPRDAWGHVSILGSCERPAQLTGVRKAGYAPALIVPSFPNGGKAFKVHGSTMIPCREQVDPSVNCVDCGLCLDADKLASKGMGIAFTPISAKANALKRRLSVV